MFFFYDAVGYGVWFLWNVIITSLSVCTNIYVRSLTNSLILQNEIFNKLFEYGIPMTYR